MVSGTSASEGWRKVCYAVAFTPLPCTAMRPLQCSFALPLRRRWRRSQQAPAQGPRKWYVNLDSVPRAGEQKPLALSSRLTGVLLKGEFVLQRQARMSTRRRISIKPPGRHSQQQLVWPWLHLWGSHKVMLIATGTWTATSMADRLVTSHGVGRTAAGAGLVGRRAEAATCPTA